MAELVVRLVFSLAVVVGLLLVVARVGARRFRGSATSPVRVVHRQPLSRTSSVAVVTVGERVLLLGTTEQQVRLLTELDPATLGDALLAPAPTPEPAVPAASPVVEPGTPGAAPDFAQVLAAAGEAHVPKHRRLEVVAQVDPSALAGSVLSPQTWRQAYAAVTGRSRRVS